MMMRWISSSTIAALSLLATTSVDAYGPKTESQKKEERFINCILAIEEADKDKDDRLSRHEYQPFVQFLSTLMFDEVIIEKDELPREVGRLYPQLIKVSGAPKGDKAIDIFGARMDELHEVSQERIEDLHNVCSMVMKELAMLGPQTQAPIQLMDLLSMESGKEFEEEEADEVATDEEEEKTSQDFEYDYHIEQLHTEMISVHNSFVISNMHSLTPNELDLSHEGILHAAYVDFIETLMENVCTTGRPCPSDEELKAVKEAERQAMWEQMHANDTPEELEEAEEELEEEREKEAEEEEEEKEKEEAELEERINHNKHMGKNIDEENNPVPHTKSERQRAHERDAANKAAKQANEENNPVPHTKSERQRAHERDAANKATKQADKNQRTAPTDSRKERHQKRVEDARKKVEDHLEEAAAQEEEEEKQAIEEQEVTVEEPPVEQKDTGAALGADRQQPRGHGGHTPEQEEAHRKKKEAAAKAAYDKLMEEQKENGGTRRLESFVPRNERRLCVDHFHMRRLREFMCGANGEEVDFNGRARRLVKAAELADAELYDAKVHECPLGVQRHSQAQHKGIIPLCATVYGHYDITVSASVGVDVNEVEHNFIVSTVDATAAGLMQQALRDVDPNDESTFEVLGGGKYRYPHENNHHVEGAAPTKHEGQDMRVHHPHVGHEDPHTSHLGKNHGPEQDRDPNGRHAHKKKDRQGNDKPHRDGNNQEGDKGHTQSERERHQKRVEERKKQEELKGKGAELGNRHKNDDNNDEQDAALGQDRGHLRRK